MNKAISDSTPLILLTKTGNHEILHQLYEIIYIPEAVYHETITAGKEREIPDAYMLEEALNKWLIVIRLDKKTELEYQFLDSNTRLGKGEIEAIKLCKQLNLNYLLTDDNEARKIAKMLNITPIGTIGTIILALKKGHITKRKTLQIMDSLIDAGLWIDIPLYKKIINEINNI